MSANSGRAYLKEVADEMQLNISEKDIDVYKDHNPDNANIKSIEMFEQDLINQILLDEKEKGLLLPWKKMNDYFRVREGELTIWTGQRGHGKSAFLNMVFLALAQQGQASYICSFEMKIKETLERMCYQWTGTAEPTVPYINT